MSQGVANVQVVYDKNGNPIGSALILDDGGTFVLRVQDGAAGGTLDAILAELQGLREDVAILRREIVESKVGAP